MGKCACKHYAEWQQDGKSAGSRCLLEVCHGCRRPPKSGLNGGRTRQGGLSRCRETGAFGGDSATAGGARLTLMRAAPGGNLQRMARAVVDCALAGQLWPARAPAGGRICRCRSADPPGDLRGLGGRRLPPGPFRMVMRSPLLPDICAGSPRGGTLPRNAGLRDLPHRRCRSRFGTGSILYDPPLDSSAEFAERGI